MTDAQSFALAMGMVFGPIGGYVAWLLLRLRRAQS